MKINQRILDLLNRLKVKKVLVDGKELDYIPDEFDEIVFYKRDLLNDLDDPNKLRIVFEDYIVTPYEGFDFHKKFNNNVAPPEKFVLGRIIKETEKLYYLSVVGTTSGKEWVGYCPKKSMRIL